MKKDFLEKLSKVKKEMGGAVVKSSKNDYFKSNYADLNTHLDLIEPVLQKHGLLLLQPIIVDTVLTQIIDIETEERVQVSMKIPASIDDMQKIGGAITYARRYLLNSLFALKAEDDDGETAVGRGKNAKKDFKKKEEKKEPNKKFKKPEPKKAEAIDDDEEEIF